MFEKFQSTVEMLAVGCTGALVSLLFRKDLTTRWQRVTAVAGGTVTAYWVAPLALDYFGMEASRAGSITFLTGLFSMAAIAAIMQALPELISKRFGSGG